MVDAPLQLQTTTEILGQFVLGGNGDSSEARLTARRAGFGVRSRVVSPNLQSSTRYFPWYHSSVQAKTMTPQQPCLKTDRTCHSKVLACFSSPLRRLSSPISLRSTGRSSLRLCSRER